jgi:hypothetical protein
MCCCQFLAIFSRTQGGFLQGNPACARRAHMCTQWLTATSANSHCAQSTVAFHARALIVCAAADLHRVQLEAAGLQAVILKVLCTWLPRMAVSGQGVLLGVWLLH